MKKSILRLLAVSALVSAPVCAFAQISFSGANPPEEGWTSEGVAWSVVDDGEGGKAIEFRNENDSDYIAFSTQMDQGFADAISESGFVLRSKIKIIPLSGDTVFSYSLNAPALSGIGITFYSRAGSTDGTLSIGSFDFAQDNNVSVKVQNALDRYLDLEAKFVPDSNGGKFTVAVDGTEHYSINVPATDKRRNSFEIKSGTKDNTTAKAVFLIKDFEIKTP